MWFSDKASLGPRPPDFVTWCTLWEHPEKDFILKFYIRAPDLTAVMQASEMYDIHIGKEDSYNITGNLPSSIWS